MTDPFLIALGKLAPLAAAHFAAIQATDEATGAVNSLSPGSPARAAAECLRDVRFAVQGKWCSAEVATVHRAFATTPTTREGFAAYLDLLQREHELFEPEHVPVLRAAALSIGG